MGDSVVDSHAALAHARALFADATDFTIGIEEEFQILDPETLELTNRFTELKALADASELAGNVAGELISSEIEVKTGRCETFAEAAALVRERRRSLFGVADQLGVTLAAVGTHPFSRWQDQITIDTPHYRIVEGTLRYIAWRNNTFGIHVHVGIRDADRAIAVNNALRGFVPELIALAANSPWLEDRFTHLRSTRTQIFTRMFPRCGVPDTFTDWDDYDAFVRFLLATRSIREHTEIWWTVRPHQAFGTVEVRACDALADVDQAIAVCALQVAIVARAARQHDAGTLPAPLRQRDIEENFWRALRFGLDGELIDFSTRTAVPAAERIRAVIEDCEAEIDELGLGSYLTPLEELLDQGDNASRYARRIEAGESIRDIFSEQVALTRSSLEQPAR